MVDCVSRAARRITRLCARTCHDRGSAYRDTCNTKCECDYDEPTIPLIVSWGPGNSAFSGRGGGEGSRVVFRGPARLPLRRSAESTLISGKSETSERSGKFIDADRRRLPVGWRWLSFLPNRENRLINIKYSSARPRRKRLFPRNHLMHFSPGIHCLQIFPVGADLTSTSLETVLLKVSSPLFVFLNVKGWY